MVVVKTSITIILYRYQPRKALLDHLSTILGDPRDSVDAPPLGLDSSSSASTTAATTAATAPLASCNTNAASSAGAAAGATAAAAGASLPDTLFIINGNEYVNANVLADLLQVGFGDGRIVTGWQLWYS